MVFLLIGTVGLGIERTGKGSFLILLVLNRKIKSWDYFFSCSTIDIKIIDGFPFSCLSETFSFLL